jgi:two-component system nitrate/nitrite response regulator NarL
MEGNIIRIIIADDHALFRSGIVSLLDDEKEIVILGEADNGKELIDLYNQLKPDLLLIDISMPEKTGLEAAKEIRKMDEDVKILFLSMHEGDDYVYHSIKSGGNGLINKNINKGELLFSIKTIMNGDSYFGKYYSETDIREIVNKYERFIEPPRFVLPTRLTDKEKEVLLLISEGLTSGEIADKLNIGKRTVDSHRMNIMQKLNLNSLPELIKYSIDYSTALGVRLRKIE